MEDSAWKDHGGSNEDTFRRRIENGEGVDNGRAIRGGGGRSRMRGGLRIEIVERVEKWRSIEDRCSGPGIMHLAHVSFEVRMAR